jgi:Protein of unknown function (DUF1553)/Protein of unknown function (DUF1549)
MSRTDTLLLIAVAAACSGALARPLRAQESETHWSFRPVQRPDPPAVSDRTWPNNPIDAFILHGVEGFKLRPASDAVRSALLRRVYLDLTGLPPTPDEQAAFANDSSRDAIERVVDRLLADPRHGERSAQHWLDLARYADTDGFEFDQARPDAWRYRDWVVQAFNSDIPFDRFIHLQMAADEIESDNPANHVATGFHRCYPDMVDMNDQAERRQISLDDVTETTGLVFLGLTIGCARCHDHKFDPISQVDFYRLQAVFSPARFVDDYAVAEGALARVLLEDKSTAEPTHVLIRGEFGRKGPEVSPGIPAILANQGDADLVAEPLEHSTGRRAALAAWLTEPSNPMTARVAVNRLWQRFFGRGIVATPSDFGSMGEPPTHPELLDWLASELVRCDWDLEHIERLIVTSRAYQMSTLANPSALEADPENALFWRQNRRRLDGETLRDAILAASGRLNPEMGGPGVFPELPEELRKLSSKGAVWPVSEDPTDRDRRSLYVFVRRNLRYPFFEAFDRPDTNASCPRRQQTTIAPQALALLNDGLVHQSARALVHRLDDEAGMEFVPRLALLYRLALARAPDASEQSLARDFLADSPSEMAGWESLALALFNLNEFVYID